MNLSTFPLGPFVVSVGALFLLIGFIISTYVLVSTVHKKDLRIKFLSDNLLIFMFLPLILGRVGAFLYLLPSFSARVATLQANSEIAELKDKVLLFIKYFFSIWEGGLDPTWIVVGFLIVFIAVCLWKKEPLLRWLDVFVMPGLIIVIFAHIGGVFAGWGYGRPVEEGALFSISYDMQNVRYSGPLYPVQIYGIIIYSILLFLSSFLWKRITSPRSKWKSGTLFGVMAFSASFTNGILEFFRGDAVKTVFLDMRLPQVISFSLSIATLIFLVIHTHESHHHEKLSKKFNKT